MKAKNHNAVRLAAILIAVFFTMNFLTLAQAQSPKAPAPAKEAGGAKVNVNQATVEQLMTISGIGPVMAKRIVDFRDKNGPFKKVEDLLAVQGIGEKNLERFKNQIAL